MLNSFFKKVSFRIQRSVHQIQLRGGLCFFIRVFLPRPELNKGNESLVICKTEKEMASDLFNEGFAGLGVALSESHINAILSKLEQINCYDLNNKDKTVVDLSNPAKEVQLAHYDREDLIEIPEIVAIANDSRVLNAVSEYLGVKPTISNVNCWWSFGDRESAKEAQFYHRDLDDYKFLKMFFYLTDVNADSGPHIYVKGSHKVNELLELRRFSDKEVESKFDRITTLIEPKGSCFIEDTYGIHKGQLPLKGNRLLLQIQYSYLPLHVEKYNPKKSTLVETMKLDRYVNRLLFSN
jgi:hypothetical protein